LNKVRGIKGQLQIEGKKEGKMSLPEDRCTYQSNRTRHNSRRTGGRGEKKKAQQIGKDFSYERKVGNIQEVQRHAPPKNGSGTGSST